MSGRYAMTCFDGAGFMRNGKALIPGYINSKYTVVDEITLNNNGDVASVLASNWQPSFSVLWKYGGDQVNLNAQLGSCGATNSNSLFMPMDMNDSQRIAGYFFQATVSNSFFNPVTFAYRTQEWMSPATCPKDLQSSDDKDPNEPGINDKGNVVGTYVDYGTGYIKTKKAVLWQNDSVFVLEDYIIGGDTMNWHLLTDARVINNSGAVAGHGRIKIPPRSAYLLVPKSTDIVMPVLGKFTITLTKASAQLVSDVYLYRPDSILLIQNNLKNVGKTVNKTFPAGTALEFAILVHPLGNGQPYWFFSGSKHARSTKASDSLWYVSFEDLPDSVADWDYNDVVLKVELNLLESLPSGNKRTPGSRTVRPSNDGWCDAFDIRGRRTGGYFLDKGKINSGRSGLAVSGITVLRLHGDSHARADSRFLIVR
jgi:hypothetical protein